MQAMVVRMQPCSRGVKGQHGRLDERDGRYETHSELGQDFSGIDPLPGETGVSASQQNSNV